MQSKVLETLPEQGMGYQIVDIELLDGTKLFNRIVLDSTFLKLDLKENLDPDEIILIKLSEKKNFR